MNYNSSFCQQNKNDEKLKSLFALSSLDKKNTVSSSIDSIIPFFKYYLIKVKSDTFDYLLKHQDVAIKRQLTNQFFIVKASDAWIINNRDLFDYVEFANFDWKLSGSLIGDSGVVKSKAKGIFHVTVNDFESFNSFLKQNFDKSTTIELYPEIKTFRIEVFYSFIHAQVLRLENVTYVENGNRIAKEESIIQNFDNAINTINLVHAEYPAIKGDELFVSVKENKFDTADIDFKGRVISNDVSSNFISSHATNMATIIAGGGNSFYSGKGAAWGANISSADFKVLLPDFSYYKKFNISVQNHSYGVGIENFYGNDALAYLQFRFSNLLWFCKR